MMSWIGLTALVILATGLAYQRAPLWVWTAVGATALVAITITEMIGAVGTTLLWVLFIILSALFNIRPLRRQLITPHLLRAFQRVLPPMSDTEREAIDAGTVWWDGELFSGRPNWQTTGTRTGRTLTPFRSRQPQQAVPCTTPLPSARPRVRPWPHPGQARNLSGTHRADENA